MTGRAPGRCSRSGSVPQRCCCSRSSGPEGSLSRHHEHGGAPALPVPRPGRGPRRTLPAGAAHACRDCRPGPVPGRHNPRHRRPGRGGRRRSSSPWLRPSSTRSTSPSQPGHPGSPSPRCRTGDLRRRGRRVFVGRRTQHRERRRRGVSQSATGWGAAVTIAVLAITLLAESLSLTQVLGGVLVLTAVVWQTTKGHPVCPVRRPEPGGLTPHWGPTPPWARKAGQCPRSPLRQPRSCRSSTSPTWDVSGLPDVTFRPVTLAGQTPMRLRSLGPFADRMPAGPAADHGSSRGGWRCRRDRPLFLRHFMTARFRQAQPP